ncbi:hypothetical protein NQ837_003296 [Providencia rettgeri]|nr:hypothetical protein [Providencia rettgeri]
MNKELLEYAKELRKRSESLIKAELENNEFNFRLSDWDKLIHPNKLIKLCNEVERINSLETVGYISQDGLNSLSDDCDAITSSKQQYNKVIPLYRLDK